MFLKYPWRKVLHYARHTIAKVSSPKRKLILVGTEIKTFSEQGVFQHSRDTTGEFISPFFFRPDLMAFLVCSFTWKSSINQCNTIIWRWTHGNCHKMMKPGCFMASLGLKDAYHTVLVHRDHQIYLKFKFRGYLYKYPCLPNGLSSATCILMKLFKPVYSTLHNQGHVSTVYIINDSYLQEDTITECQENIVNTVELITELGFYIYPTKSILYPAQRVILFSLWNTNLLL